MLLEMAVADAYGIGFEFVPDSADRPNDLSRYHMHPKYGNEINGLKPGNYTDDTQRAIANALVVLQGNPLDPFSYMEYYLRVFRADPRKGYSKRYQSLLESVTAMEPDDSKAVHVFNASVTRKATSNGSIMGVAPLGYLHSPNTVALAAAIQAMTTHGIETVIYAQAIALFAHYHIYNNRYPKVTNVDSFINQYSGSEDLVQWEDVAIPRVDMSAKTTYKAVRQCLCLERITQIMLRAVEMTGDTDSVAASAVALASVAPDRYTNDIPDHLMDSLEAADGVATGAERRDELRALDDKLRWYAMA